MPQKYKKKREMKAILRKIGGKMSYDNVCRVLPCPGLKTLKM